jgi:hypothetical protein
VDETARQVSGLDLLADLAARLLRTSSSQLILISDVQIVAAGTPTSTPG